MSTGPLVATGKVWRSLLVSKCGSSQALLGKPVESSALSCKKSGMQ